MQKLRDVSEDEMIATFLKADLHSTRRRFSETIAARLNMDRQPRSIVDRPDFDNPAGNAYRRTLLAEYRGYGRGHDVFYGFPDSVSWSEVALRRDELGAVKYLNYDYFVQLTEGTRLLADGARAATEGKIVFGVPSTGFLRAAEAVRRGVVFPDPIAAFVDGTLVLLDGQTRTTAYVLAAHSCPEEALVLVGCSPGFVAWDANDFSN